MHDVISEQHQLLVLSVDRWVTINRSLMLELSMFSQSSGSPQQIVSFHLVGKHVWCVNQIL